MWKRVCSLMIVLVLLVSCIPATSALSLNRYNRYFRHYLRLYTVGMPQTIKGCLTYDTEKFDILPNYTDTEPDGYDFCLASDMYQNLYDVDYTIEDGVISFEYTLKANRDIEDLYDALDAKANHVMTDRRESVRHEFDLLYTVLGSNASLSDYSSLCSGTVTEQINDDGTVMISDGKTIGDTSVSSSLGGLSNTNAIDHTFDMNQEEFFLSQYDIESKALNEFRALYRHRDSNKKIDWAVFIANTTLSNGTPEYYEFGNRVLRADNSAYPFKFNVGIYNVKRGRFFDITECSIEDYPDLEAVWTEIGDGRLIGDMDGDNSLTVSDATIIQRCAAGIRPYPEDDANSAAESNPDAIKYFSDFDADSDRGIVDATMIQRYIADMPYRTAEWSPYEEPVEPMREPDDLSIPRITGFRSLGKGIEISVDPVPGAEKYRFYFKNKNGNWEKMGETTGAPFVSTNSIEVGKTYSYTVRCIKADLSSFTSDYDKTGWSYTYSPQLDTPQITRVEATNDGVKIRWNPVDGADLYRVYYRSSSLQDWKQIGDTAATNIEFNNVKAESDYYYTVRCLSMGGKGFASAYNLHGYSFRLRKPELRDLEAHQDSISFVASEASGNKIAVYRKEKSGWKRLDVLSDGKRYYDYDVEPGKSYTYTCRSLSDDGSYFVSLYNKTGWTQNYTLAECKPDLQSVIYLGDDQLMVIPTYIDNFGISKYGFDMYHMDEYLGSGIVDAGDTTVLRGDVFKNYQYIKIYVVGLNEKNEPITDFSENGYSLNMLQSPANLRVKLIGDRKYRFRWDKAHNEVQTYAFVMVSENEEPEIGNEYVNSLYYDVDLSDYPEDANWQVFVWASDSNGLSNSETIAIDFCEADFNSETE